MGAEIDERVVELSDLKSGIRLRTGRTVVLRVNGLRGKSRGQFQLHLELEAAGGTPLANEKVRIHDPDTGEQVGTATTDEKGVLQVAVPAEKEYHVFVETEPPENHPDELADALQGHLREPDRHALLWVALVDPDGSPVKGEKIHVEGEDAAPQETETDEEGSIHMVVEPGTFTLQVRGESFVAHSVFHDDPVAGDAAPYRFVLR